MTIVIGVNPGLPVFSCAFPSVPIVRVESSRFTQRGFIVFAIGEIIGIRKKSLCGQRRAFILIVDPVSASNVRRSIPKVRRPPIQDRLKELKRWAFLITNVSPYSWSLVHLPIPIFCCLQALLCWALQIGSQNRPMWLSGRGDW